jgi:hypothetical protein
MFSIFLKTKACALPSKQAVEFHQDIKYALETCGGRTHERAPRRVAVEARCLEQLASESPVRRTHPMIHGAHAGRTRRGKDMPARKVRKFLSPKRNVDVMRMYYCYQLGSTFVSLGLMETRIVTAMMTCDRIKLSKVIQDDVPF